MVALCLVCTFVVAQSPAVKPATPQKASPSVATNLPAGEVPAAPQNSSPPARKDNTWLVAGIVGGASAAVIVAGSLSWWNRTGFTGKWTTASEGFFGEQTYVGGSDKLGHLMACYAGTRGMTAIFESVHVPHRNAVLISAGAVFLMSNGVELADAFSPYGFAYEDVVFNSVGIGLATVAELYPWFDQYFGLRFAYFSSEQYLKMHKSDNLFNKYTELINDYSGMMFLYDFKFAGLKDSLGRTFLKYFLVGVNYSTVDYQPAGPDRQRSIGMHVGLNLSDTIKDTWNIQENTLAQIGYVVTKYLAFPLTNVGVLYDLNSGRTHFHVGMASRLRISF